MLKTLAASPLPLGATPFSSLKADDYLPAIEEALKSALEDFEKIKTNPEAPSFENTIEALEFLGQDAERVSTIFFNLVHACTTPELDALAPEISQKLAEYSNDIQLDEQIFARIETVYNQRDSLGLNPQQMKLLVDAYKDFSRNGAHLKGADKEKLREIDNKMAKIGPEFGQNLLKATNAFSLNVTDEASISALPMSARQSAKEEAEKKNQKGWTFTLNAPSYVPFLQYMPDRKLRETLWMASNTKAFADEYSNQELCKQIATLRAERAQLLGYKSHAHFTLERRMAKTPEEVQQFLNDLKKPAIVAAEKEVADLQAFVKNELKDDISLMPWDFAFYSKKYKEHLFNFDEEELRPYFPLESAIQGIFIHGEKLYGLSFEKTDIPTYHEDVNAYEVKRQGKHVGLLYLDFFPRDNKRSGAWMTNYQDQGFNGKEIQNPHVSLVCNFTKPAGDTPSLLTFNELQTLFHEFGHGLHSLLSNCHYPSQSGTNVMWDFVELPSQVMENWTYEKEALDLFAKHYKTGESLPQDLVDKLKASAKFQAGFGTTRQLSFSSVDLNWHSLEKNHGKDLSPQKMEDEAMKDFRVLPAVPGTNFSVGFSHIFAGGYSAAYYSYKWAEVLDADAFEYFKDEGIFNPTVATKFYDEVLSKGGTDDPMTLYKNFRGRPPKVEALLKRSGLL